MAKTRLPPIKIRRREFDIPKTLQKIRKSIKEFKQKREKLPQRGIGIFGK